MRTLSATTLFALTASLLLAGCDLVPSPEHQSAEARKAAEHHELRDAIQAKDYRKRAADAAQPVLDADKQHDKAIDDAGG
ncbi:hypothetical protein BH11PSE14_BH11PSE14_17720 [soil metagenome]